MTPFPPFSRPPVGWVSAPVLPSCWGADQLAEVELPTAPSALFFPVAIVRDDLATLETAADRHERLAAATRMLRHPGSAHLPTSTIATEAGFSDPSHFHRAFRYRYGMTPGEWQGR